MDLNKAQGRQLVSDVPKTRKKMEFTAIEATSDNLDDPTDILDEQDISEEIQPLYIWRKKTIHCIKFEQHRAYLKCPLCPEYDTCPQLRREQRIELETSPFFSIKEIIWKGPRRTKTMYIAVCTDGSLRRLDNFDPKNNDGINLDDYKDVEEVLVVTKAFRRKVIWAPVPMEQIKANRSNGGSMVEPENLMNKEDNPALAPQQGQKRIVKLKNGKKK